MEEPSAVTNQVKSVASNASNTGFSSINRFRLSFAAGSFNKERGSLN